MRKKLETLPLSELKAIAKEGCVESPMSTSFMRKYDLPTSSSIKTALDTLQEKDLIYRQESGYIIYDTFFELWLKQL
jgi:hypothetical protein